MNDVADLYPADNVCQDRTGFKAGLEVSGSGSIDSGGAVLMVEVEAAEVD